MKKAICPKCQIPSFYLKSRSGGEHLSIYVTRDGEIVPKHKGDSLEGYDMQTIYCYGCSWSGSLSSLLKIRCTI